MDFFVAGFVADAFDILMRHKVNQESGLQLKITPFISRGLTCLTPEDVSSAMKIMASKKPGTIMVLRD